MADEKSSNNSGAAASTQPATQTVRMVKCVKFGREMPGLDRVPWKGEIGKRIYECLQGSLETLGRTLEDADERIPPEPARPEVPANHGRTNGNLLLR